MLQAEGAEGPVKVEFDNFEHGFPEGFGPGGWGHLAYAIGIAFAVFQLYVAAFNYLPSQVVRGIHVGFLLLLTLRPDRQLHAPKAMSAARSAG